MAIVYTYVMANYNGHKNWNHWNVALWLNNDPSLYSVVRYYKDECPNNLNAAARRILDDLTKDCGLTHTPDGAPYTLTAIRAAIRN